MCDDFMISIEQDCNDQRLAEDVAIVSRELELEGSVRSDRFRVLDIGRRRRRRRSMLASSLVWAIHAGWIAWLSLDLGDKN